MEQGEYKDYVTLKLEVSKEYKDLFWQLKDNKIHDFKSFSDMFAVALDLGFNELELRGDSIKSIEGILESMMPKNINYETQEEKMIITEG